MSNKPLGNSKRLKPRWSILTKRSRKLIVRERSETRFTEGISSLDPVLDAEQALDPLQRQLATTRTDAWRQLSALVRSTGGTAAFRPFDSE